MGKSMVETVLAHNSKSVQKFPRTNIFTHLILTANLTEVIIQDTDFFLALPNPYLCCSLKIECLEEVNTLSGPKRKRLGTGMYI